MEAAGHRACRLDRGPTHFGRRNSGETFPPRDICGRFARVQNSKNETGLAATLEY